mgnify:CR=1 FL=1
MTKLLRLLKSALAMFLATLVFFGVLEALARFVYPEFRGHVHSATKTLGVNYFLANEVPIRIPEPDFPIRFDRPMVIVLGDSISHGYGMAYEDIYWVRLARMTQLERGAKAPEFISLSYYGNNLQDSVAQIEKFLNQHRQAEVRQIIYQFNFNDVVPEAYGRSALHAHDNSPGQPRAIEGRPERTHPTPSAPSAQATVTSAVASTAGSAPNTIVAETATPAKAIEPAIPQASVTAIEPARTQASATAQVEASPAGARAWAKAFAAAWRSEYMNYSVFLRVAQHFAGKLARKTAGDCMARDLSALGPYTWTYGSRKFAEESEALWHNFEEALARLKQEADSRGAELVIVVSPLLFDIDKTGAHPQYNYLNFDFSCATIDPRARLNRISDRLGIKLLDPTDYMRQAFESRVREGNFTPFFVTADENHITPVAAALMAEYLYVERTLPVAP